MQLRGEVFDLVIDLAGGAGLIGLGSDGRRWRGRRDRDRKNRKTQDEQKKREKTLADAAERLRQAQAAYQAEIDKAKGGSNDKSKSGVQ